MPETCDKAICGSDRTPGHLAHMEFMEVQDKNKQASSASAHTQLDPSRSACGPAVFAKAGQAGRMQGPCDIAREQSTHRRGHSLLIKSLRGSSLMERNSTPEARHGSSVSAGARPGLCLGLENLPGTPSSKD